ncbi:MULTISPECIES: ParB N-terminal domain-containing protein [Bradyrhizobium]|uniref:hypothetical protein n=1 Tax=Bradyrhizobium TaxID=374 RepID=UPI0004BC27A3|nr:MULTISPECIES: hypothetical protein [unclassified Bradyrhizobium]MDA9415536.1 hypothetical protein [Bradyrhizobium sp. CCBAU 25360]MDA9456558.1 hypothetical protein [Bradyrhizobium sp. CCBAU 21359]MDA9515431.1 hypothetical protein [Bradyrhizobium sp. CCBAU 11430]
MERQPALLDGARPALNSLCRYAAAKSLGLAEVPVVPLGHLSEAARRAYCMADNRIAESST